MAIGQKTGGRVAGTPNKVSGRVRAAIANIVDEYLSSGRLADDMDALEPKDRVAAIEKLAAYVSPKLQTTMLDMSDETKRTIEDKLSELSGDE